MIDKYKIILIKFWLKTRNFQEIPEELIDNVKDEEKKEFHTQLKHDSDNKLDKDNLIDKLLELEHKITREKEIKKQLKIQNKFLQIEDSNHIIQNKFLLLEKENQKIQKSMKEKQDLIVWIMLLTAIIMIITAGITYWSATITKDSANINNESFNLYSTEVSKNLELIDKQYKLMDQQYIINNNQIEPQLSFQIIPSKANRNKDNFTVKSSDINNDFSLDVKISNVGEKTVQIWDLAVTDNCFNEISGSHGWLGFEGDILYSKRDITYTFNSSKSYVKKYFNQLNSTNKSCVMTFRLGTNHRYYFRELKIDKS